MPNNEPTTCPDLLPFSYRINKIVRDMKHTQVPNEATDDKRNAIVASLQDICHQIDEAFS